MLRCDRATVSAMGDKTQPAAGAVPAATSSAPVYFPFPKKRQEGQLLAQYRAQDTVRLAGPTPKRIAT